MRAGEPVTMTPETASAPGRLARSSVASITDHPPAQAPAVLARIMSANEPARLAAAGTGSPVIQIDSGPATLPLGTTQAALRTRQLCDANVKNRSTALSAFARTASPDGKRSSPNSSDSSSQG